MSQIDYSALRPNLKNDRWSPLATFIYTITLLSLLFTLIIFCAVVSHFELTGLIVLLVAIILSSLCLLISRMFFKRTNPAQIEDLVEFAAANNFSVQSNPLISQLHSVVLIELKFDPLYPPHPWRYTIDLQLDGLYQSYPISFYNISLDPGTTTDSGIENDTAEMHYQETESQASITLTLRQYKAGILAARYRAVVLWALPSLSPTKVKKIRSIARRYGADAQADSNQLAILLPSTLPYDRSGVMRLYRTLDRIYYVAKS